MKLAVSKYLLASAIGMALAAPAYAQDASGAANGDIIVTARRVEERRHLNHVGIQDEAQDVVEMGAHAHGSA